jgi:hypothetical protein
MTPSILLHAGINWQRLMFTESPLSNGSIHHNIYADVSSVVLLIKKANILLKLFCFSFRFFELLKVAPRFIGNLSGLAEKYGGDNMAMDCTKIK